MARLTIRTLKVERLVGRIVLKRRETAGGPHGPKTRQHKVRWRHPREHLVLCAGRNETSVGLNDALVRPRQPRRRCVRRCSGATLLDR